MSEVNDPARQADRLDVGRLIVGTLVTIVVLVLCLFPAAGDWTWRRGWAFFGGLMASFVVVGLYLRRVNPAVIAARANKHEGTKPWDYWVTGVLIMLLVLTMPLAALDDSRFHWSNAPWWVCVTGYVLLTLGMAGMTWAEAVNRFFEPTVRIQAERGHHVIDSGPYALVRHPGYVSAFFLVFGIPLSLGSYWALIPAVLTCVVLVVRTVLEDRMLRAELPGYREYAGRVRYRLLPGLW